MPLCACARAEGGLAGDPNSGSGCVWEKEVRVDGADSGIAGCGSGAVPRRMVSRWCAAFGRITTGACAPPAEEAVAGGCGPPNAALKLASLGRTTGAEWSGAGGAVDDEECAPPSKMLIRGWWCCGGGDTVPTGGRAAAPAAVGGDDVPGPTPGGCIRERHALRAHSHMRDGERSANR